MAARHRRDRERVCDASSVDAMLPEVRARFRHAVAVTDRSARRSCDFSD